MRKMIAAMTIVAAGVGIGSNVFAGEVNGSDNPNAKGPQATVGIWDGTGGANSICAFSGLNDVPTGDQAIDEETGEPIFDEDGKPVIDQSTVGRVQNWGHTRQYVKANAPAEAFAGFLAGASPGVTCNGATGEVANIPG